MVASNRKAQEFGAKDFFLVRQSIFSTAQELIGYKLLFYSKNFDRKSLGEDTATTALVMAQATELGVHNIIGSVVAFFQVDTSILMSDVLFSLPKDSVVLEIPGTVELTHALIQRLELLALAGFIFAIGDVVEQSYRTELLMPLADIVKLDVHNIAFEQLASLIDDFKLKGKKLLADKIECVDIFMLCRDCGFDYFQGHYFTKPDILSSSKFANSDVWSKQILRHIIKGAHSRDIVRLIRQEVGLPLLLLRLVNTPLYGFRRNIASLGHALLVFGDRQLKRWLQILLYANHDNASGNASSPLMMLAATRGKMCELLAQRIHPLVTRKSDCAFTVGILSLVHALYNLEMAEVLKQFDGISSEMRDALLLHGGFYGGLLQLVEWSERPDILCLRQLSLSLDTLGLSSADFYEIQKEAFEWGNSIFEHISIDSSESKVWDDEGTSSCWLA